MLCTALGLALAFAPAKAIAQACALLVATALAMLAVTDGNLFSELQARIGCGVSIVLTALCVHAPGGVRPWAAWLLAVNAGFWSGLIGSMASMPSALLGLPLVLLALPGRWIVSRHYAIVLKVLSGWLVAVALLTATLPLITTPGYEPDHME